MPEGRRARDTGARLAKGGKSEAVAGSTLENHAMRSHGAPSSNSGLRAPALTGLLLLAAAIGCSKPNDPPAAQPGYPNTAPAAGPVTQPAGYGTAQQAPVLAAAPGAAAPAASLSQPSPFALPCQSDGQCLTHHCNVAVHKCAWPCQTDNDCMPGNACIAPTCLPKLQ